MSVGLCCETYPTFFYILLAIGFAWIYDCRNTYILGTFWIATVPNRGKHVTHVGQARYPTWASTVPKIRTNIVFLSTQNNPTAPLPPGFPFKSSKYR